MSDAQVIVIDQSDQLERKFYYIDSYLASFDKREAMLKAGFTGNPYYTFTRIMADPLAKEYYEQSLRDHALSKELVLARLGDIARGAYAKYISRNGEIDLHALTADGKQYLIKKITWSRFGVQIEFHDSMVALGLLAKHYGITVEPTFADKEVQLRVTYAKDDVTEDKTIDI